MYFKCCIFNSEFTVFSKVVWKHSCIWQKMFGGDTVLTVYHLNQQKWQKGKNYKEKKYWILGYLKTDLSSCVYVHIIPKCSALDYFYKYIPLKQPIIAENWSCIFIQLFLQSIFSYSGEITIFPEFSENKFTLLKLSKAKKEHKPQVIQAE